ncbi:hypothetical protein ACFPM0_10495 [Pseudonocardia sulfidoxydans]|uniref:hypothetical protein n=1 Tax=Pseudonocardia sulfidoxydans TaxID=54011 RepID=UPI00361A0331
MPGIPCGPAVVTMDGWRDAGPVGRRPVSPEPVRARRTGRPNGSATMPMRPNGVLSGAITTAPPPACTAATAASTSATPK